MEAPATEETSQEEEVVRGKGDEHGLTCCI